MQKRRFAKLLDCELAIIDKRRDHTTPNKCEALNVIGDVYDKVCILFDDMIDTGGTMAEASSVLKDKGCWDIFACATHGVLSGKVNQNLAKSPIEHITLTNTIPTQQSLTTGCTYLSTAKLFADAIERIHKEESVSELF